MCLADIPNLKAEDKKAQAWQSREGGFPGQRHGREGVVWNSHLIWGFGWQENLSSPVLIFALQSGKAATRILNIQFLTETDFKLYFAKYGI